MARWPTRLPEFPHIIDTAPHPLATSIGGKVIGNVSNGIPLLDAEAKLPMSILPHGLEGLLSLRDIRVPTLGASLIGQGTWESDFYNNQYLNFFFCNVSNNDGDNCTFKIFLTPGRYSILLYTMEDNNRGKMHVRLNEEVINIYDLFYPSKRYNVIRQNITPLVTTTGLQNLKITVDGRNPLSFGYLIGLTLVWFFPFLQL